LEASASFFDCLDSCFRRSDMMPSFPRKRESMSSEARHNVFQGNTPLLITNWHTLSDRANSYGMEALPNHLYPYVGAQGFGDRHAAIGLLVVLQNSYEDAGQGQSRAIQGVDKLRLSA